MAVAILWQLGSSVHWAAKIVSQMTGHASHLDGYKLQLCMELCYAVLHKQPEQVEPQDAAFLRGGRNLLPAKVADRSHGSRHICSNELGQGANRTNATTHKPVADRASV